MVNEHMVSRNKQTRNTRRGAAAVETAAILPVLILFIFGGIEFGRFFMCVHGIKTACREACRASLVTGATADNAKLIIQERLAGFDIDDYTVTVDPDPISNACQWDPVTITISTTYADVAWLPTPLFLTDVPMNFSCTLPRESNECNQ